jgi:hypothetical protein
MTFLGSAATAYPQSMAFHKNAFALCVRPLDIPDGAPPGARRVTGDNISIRMIPYYDGTNDISNYRFDVLYGVKSVYPELAVPRERLSPDGGGFGLRHSFSEGHA